MGRPAVNSYRSENFECKVVGADAHIGPAERTVFYGNLRRIRSCPMGRQSRRPLQRRFTFLVGADDSVRPQNILVLRESSANSQLPNGPMWASAPTVKAVGAYEFAEDSYKITAFCGRSRTLPRPRLGRIRTALQISNAERFCRSHLNVTACKFGVP